MGYFDFLSEDTIFPLNHFWTPFALYTFSQNLWLTVSLIFLAESGEELLYCSSFLLDIVPNVKMNESSADSLLLDPILGSLGIIASKFFIKNYNIPKFIFSKKYMLEIILLGSLFFAPLPLLYGIDNNFNRLYDYPGRRYLRDDTLIYTCSYSLWLGICYKFNYITEEWENLEKYKNFYLKWWIYFICSMIPNIIYLSKPPIITILSSLITLIAFLYKT